MLQRFYQQRLRRSRGGFAWSLSLILIFGACDALRGDPSGRGEDQSPTPDGILDTSSGDDDSLEASQMPDNTQPTDEEDASPSATPQASPEDTTPEPTMDPTPRPITPTPVYACPDDMVPILEDTEILYCIDAYEDIVEGALGSLDQYAAEATPTTAVTFSQVAVIPTVQLSFDQAAAACAQTPVFGSEGIIFGYKRMPMSQEWEDAADGQPGEGGLTYPYGDSFDASACATLDDEHNTQYFEVQPTGSFEDCISPFGTYDQSGNAWEWADSGIRINVQATLEYWAENYAPVAIDEAAFLYLPSPKNIIHFTHTIIEAQPPQLDVDEEGYLIDLNEYVSPYEIQRAGYLQTFAGPETEENFLPVELIDVGEPGTPRYRLHLMREDDGATVPDKRGCAYYNGETDCVLYAKNLEHLHDFDGTIGVRCVSDPVRIQ